MLCSRAYMHPGIYCINLKNALEIRWAENIGSLFI